MGFSKPTEENPLRIYVGGERMYRAATFFQVLGHNAEAQGPCIQGQGQLNHRQEHSPRPPAAGLTRTQQSDSPILPQETEVWGQKWSGNQQGSSPAPSPSYRSGRCPHSSSLSQLRRPESPVGLSATAPRCVRRASLQTTPWTLSSTYRVPFTNRAPRMQEVVTTQESLTR